MEKGLFREIKLQSEKDLAQIEALARYIDESPGESITKFDNFTKYIQRTALSKFLARYEIFKLQLDVPGSIVELGVGRGASLMAWAQFSVIFEPVNYTRQIIGFDTFEGIPSIEEKDRTAENRESNLMQKKGFRVETGMLEDIRRAVEVFNTNRPLSHLEKIRLVKGDITKTLTPFLKDNPQLVISLLNLDVDLYRPTKLAIELLLERVPKGGVVIFDELNSAIFPGETVALTETLGIHSLKLKRFPWATTISYAIME